MHAPTSALVRVVPFFYGWWVVAAAAAIVFLTVGTFFYGFSTLIDPFEKEFGWSRGLIGGAFSTVLVTEGLTAPLAGHVADRFGAPRVLVTGVLVMGGGFVLLGQIHAAWALYATMVVIALGMTMCGPMVCWVAVAHWFVKKRGRALALMSCGVGTCGVMVVVLAGLISLLGWRSAVVTIGVSQIALCVPLALTVRHRPEDMGLLADGEGCASGQPLAKSAVASPTAESNAERKVQDEGFTIREALGTRFFWLLTVALTLAGAGSMAVIGHLVAFLEESANFSRGAASAVAMGIPFVSLGGRIAFGWMADYVPRRRLLAMAFVFQGLGVFTFAFVDSPWQAILFLLLFSAGWGGAIPLEPTIQAEYFGLRAFGGIHGLMWAVATLGVFGGPIFAGAVYDTVDSYRPAFVLMTLTTMAAVPAVLAMGRPRSWPQEPVGVPGT